MRNAAENRRRSTVGEAEVIESRESYVCERPDCFLALKLSVHGVYSFSIFYRLEPFGGDGLQS
jgi:hypothetical protein